MAEPREVRSRDNPLMLRIRKLAGDAAAYRKLGQVWIEGDHLCRALLSHGARPSQAVITQAAWDDDALHDLAVSADQVAIVPQALMAGLSALGSPTPIGFIAPWQGAGEIAPGLPSVVLDRLQDAGNVGTILRTASAFGFAQVIAMKGTAALWSPKVLRAGMGAHFGLRLVEGAESISSLALPSLAASSHASQLLHSAALPWPCAWVLGHEGHGVSQELLRQCALTLRIPQPGGEESLNVAVAAAICMYESVRQRG